MSERVVMLPGPVHPITTEANRARVVVRAGGRVIADSTLSLTLREASHPAVRYIPRADVDMAALTRSTHASYCPYKGEATYFSVEVAKGVSPTWPGATRTRFPPWQGLRITSPSTRTAWTASPSSQPTPPPNDRRKAG